MSLSYKVGDCGLLVGMLRTPQGLSEETFFKKEVVDNLSGNYLSGFHKEMKGNTPDVVENYGMFKPVGFKMLGEHNVGFLMLIDDFAYPNRIFHPAHGLRNDEDEIFDYEYQISTCIDTFENDTTSPSLEDFFNEVCVKSDFPFLCIGQLKINNGLLLGNGIDYTEFVKKGIQKVAMEFPSLKIHVLDCLGSSELVIIAFSYNLSSIALFTHKIRSLRFESLKDISKTMYKKIEGNSLLYGKNDMVMEQKEQIDYKAFETGEKFNIGKSHLFAFAYSYLGYRIDMFDNLNKQLNSHYKFEEEDKYLNIFLEFDWEVKPGHSEGIRKGLKDIIGLSPKDFLYIKNSSWVYSLSYSYNEKEKFFFNVEQIKGLDKKLEHSRKLSIRVNVDDTNENSRFNDCFDEKLHPSLNIYLKKQRFEKLNNIRRNLDLCHVSKVMRERVMKMYNNYNNCVKDPGFFISFLDLKGFLQTVNDRLENYILSDLRDRESLMDLHNWLNLCVASFEQAYFNRFHQSNRMREISDFNLEWNGGIQQLVSPFDFVWKSINRYLGKEDIRFMYVSGYERVHVSPIALRINMFHLTYPELFVLSVWKEVFNRSLPELYKTEVTIDSFDFEQKKEAMNLFKLVKQYKTSQYQGYLKVEIGQDVDFDITSMVHRSLYRDFDQEFYISLVADSMAFYIGYNGDIDLFVYYYWRFLFQTTYYYTQDGQLEPEVFLRMLCRILFVMSLEYKDKIEDLRLKPFDPTLGEYWINYFDETLTFVNIIEKVLRRNMYINSIKGSAFILMYDEMEQFCQRQKGGNYYDSIRDILTKSEADDHKFERWLNKSDDQVSSPLILRHELFRDAQEKFYKEIEKGKIIREDLNNVPELFLNTLFYAFLKYLRFLDIEEKEVTSLLKVRPQRMYEECLQYMSNIVSDRSGGMLVINYKTRRDYFAARASLYRSIFDYCMRNKYVVESVKKAI